MSDLATHGAAKLAAVTVDANNAELRDADGFIGDRASKRAFSAILEDWRERLRRVGEDPLGETPTDEIGKRKLDKILVDGDPEAAGLVHSAIEEFATELAGVAKKLLKLKAWKPVQRIVVGGGLRESRVGELAIGRAAVILKADAHEIEMIPIRHHPDHAGLLGSMQLAPSWVFEGHDAILAVDIGGSNMRAGIVQLGKGGDLGASKVVETELWRHADEETKPKREEAVDRLGEMLVRFVKSAQKSKLKLAPFIGVGCPGVIMADGTIERGGQNLPGNWESSRFNLPARLQALVGKIGEHDPLVIMHNDAVVQGLSEVPFMQDVAHWGVLTIGTGLGNACFTNLAAADKAPKKEKAASG